MGFSKIGLVLFLVAAAITAAAEARFDVNTVVAQALMGGERNYMVKSTTTACCDNCACTKSIPPKCKCNDILPENCHSACKNCICNFKYPRTCVCTDITNFCYDSCSSAAKPN
ncbi:Bowman-Birk type proteinase inhibitor-like [Prosopis cineraria]|uniref:Bowman-Birk type proteinase inhibitor-like n=1 Tax=Prosopis cineraria TaxID=364024 RepID=UPI00241081DE|nr:Bowman-Birk type proteinase inhibitor-like [Prosopis cineraria]